MFTMATLSSLLILFFYNVKNDKNNPNVYFLTILFLTTELYNVGLLWV